MKIIDAFTFNGEFDLLEIRLNILSPFVDEFIIVEATETFSGKPKELYYEKEKELFAKWADKIQYFVANSAFYEEKYMALANGSPNTRGAEHWKREFCQKECIKDALEEAKIADEDIVFVGDVDEIWEPWVWRNPTAIPMYPMKLKLKVYSYWLNNRSSEEFNGTLVAQYKDIKGACLNHLRSDSIKSTLYDGWHFTSMGGYEEVKRKLSDSYTRESYWTPDVESNLQENMAQRRDFLGRDFKYWKDESEWPQYLKDNRKKYEHLL